MMKDCVTVSDTVLETSCLVSELVVKTDKLHTIAETYILSVCKEMVRVMLSANSVNEIAKVRLSDYAICRHMLTDTETALTKN